PAPQAAPCLSEAEEAASKERRPLAGGRTPGASARGGRRRSTLLGGVVANLVEALADPLVEDVERLGIRLGDELGQLARIGETLLDRLLRILRLLREAIL